MSIVKFLTYEKGTGKLLKTSEIEVPEEALSSLAKLVIMLLEKGVLTDEDASLFTSKLGRRVE